jgi:hypothetical protein
MKSTDLDQQNCNVFASYSIGDKLLIEWESEIILAIVTGFTYNNVGELILVIDNFLQAKKPLHPFSKYYKITKV